MPDQPSLALYTFGIFERPAEDPVNDGFYQRNDPILEAVDRAPGLIARSGYDGDPGPPSWGRQVYPRFFTDENGDGWSPATLSLWQDLESAFAFGYFGLHAEALPHGRTWFRIGPWPPLVLWWHRDDAPPDWAEAVSRHHRLHDHGPSPEAFTFAQAFDPSGERVRIDKLRVRALASEPPAQREET
jgi:hypothetical protein